MLTIGLQHVSCGIARAKAMRLDETGPVFPDDTEPCSVKEVRASCAVVAQNDEAGRCGFCFGAHRGHALLRARAVTRLLIAAVHLRARRRSFHCSDFAGVASCFRSHPEDMYNRGDGSTISHSQADMTRAIQRCAQTECGDSTCQRCAERSFAMFPPIPDRIAVMTAYWFSRRSTERRYNSASMDATSNNEDFQGMSSSFSPIPDRIHAEAQHEQHGHAEVDPRAALPERHRVFSHARRSSWKQRQPMNGPAMIPPTM